MKEDNNNPIKGVLVFIIGMSLIFGLIRGCTSTVVGDGFSKGFFEETNWVIKIIILVIFIVIVSGLFGFFKNK